jgi:hypothetical protein
MEMSKEFRRPLSITIFRTINRCSRLLRFVSRTALPPSSFLRRSTHRLLAFKLRALEKTVSLLMALEAESLLDMALALLISQRSIDGTQVNSASVLRRSAMTALTSSTSSTTSTTVIALPDFRGSD